jgi:hypothetical protein
LRRAPFNFAESRRQFDSSQIAVNFVTLVYPAFRRDVCGAKS